MVGCNFDSVTTTSSYVAVAIIASAGMYHAQRSTTGFGFPS